MAAITLRRVTKSFGPVHVIKGVDLAIEPNEFVVFVGPSGCGKSTLLRLIAGLEDITSGELLIGEEIVNDLPPAERGISMVFQSYALYPHMSVEENMAFGLKLAKVDPKAAAERVQNAARILQITHLLDRKPKQLSGGQRQRVAIGRAIVRSPRVFLFDEPLSNLDAALRVQMRIEIAKLHHELDATMVYVTHDQVEAMTLADRIVVLEAGHVRQFGAPLELYQHPHNKFVAGFIGAPAMNLLPGRIEGGSAFLPDGTRLPVAAKPGEVTIGIRPERLTWLAEGAPAEGAVVAAPALVVEPLGSETLVTLDVAGHSLHARVPPKSVRRSGEMVRLAVAPDSVHLFDRVSGARL